MEAQNKTALYDEHVKLGAKLIDFGGWMMPIRYGSAIEEHHFVRKACGLFDVSHMGELRIKGEQAEAFVQYLTTNDVTKLRDGCGQYSGLLDDQGGFIDDLIVYRLQKDDFFLCVNASNTRKDADWVKKQSAAFKVQVDDESSQWSQIAIQGPQSRECLMTLLKDAERATLADLPYTQIRKIPLFGQQALIARTGYTGELGYEVYLNHSSAIELWLKLLQLGTSRVAPIGLGARDSLRLEAGYLLYGNDMDENVTPLEVGISWAVKLDKGDFIGRDRLVKMKEAGVPRHLVAFKMTEPGIARSHMDLFQADKKVGIVTSAAFLPTLDLAGGMALVDKSSGQVGDKIEIDIRGKRKLAEVVKKPLYSPKVK
ncbi:MAG: glycine cleavage system aminomethyltransferase GcvT [Oligoflexales bacterium]|nr:glycine cleavage system aminomethyltransferase GcvT [Oligoflexales bacterium]